MKRNSYQLYKSIVLLFLINIPTLYAHNFINGVCEHHCEDKFKVKNNKNKLINAKEQKQINSNNSCLNKFLCRG